MRRTHVVAFLCLIAAATLASAGEDPASLVAACDPAEWSTAKLGRDALLRATGLADAVLVMTGGVLSASAAPDGAASAFPVAMLDAAGFDIVNLAHRDLVGDSSLLVKAIGASKASFVSATFSLPEGGETPWEPFAVIERGGTRTAFVGVAARSASLDLPESGVIEGLRVTEPRAAIEKALEAISGKADRVVLLADAPVSSVSRWLGEFEEIEVALISSRAGILSRSSRRGRGARRRGRCC
jgi:2',3'-cyclic-nucleotide 2'-phosphodiesterase (5'-nucleotidase family)